MALYGPINSGAAAGSAGSATANNSSSVPLHGRVVGIYVLYNDSPPVTTDVTIKTVGTSPAPPTYNLLAISNSNSDGWYYPQEQIHTTSAAPIAAQYTPLLIHDLLNVTIAGANAGDNVDVWVMLDIWPGDQ